MSGRKEESRSRILASAGRGFRSRGYGGLGVDELAKQAGVTSGAFYAHFKSKAAAFREAVEAGMDDLRGGVEHFRAAGGDGWLGAFIDFYLGERREADLADSCALQSLTGDVARAGQEVREMFGAKLESVLRALTAGSPGAPDRAQAIALLALLSGAVSMARAVEDPAVREEIAASVRLAAERLVGRGPG